MKILQILSQLIQNKGSDLHIKVGLPPVMRVKGKLQPASFPPITPETVQELISPLLTPVQKQKFEKEKELDFSFNVEGLSRFRGNLFYQKGYMGAVFRTIPNKIPSLNEMNMPPVLKEIINKEQGLILVTGPTGSGKSTTLAALINEINENRSCHIMTIEDPIEFVHKDKVSLINQREVGGDTSSFGEALKRALRQDPDIILVGEMRDAETIKIAITAAETGHMVFSTLHTNDAKQTVDRIIKAFPADEQEQIRLELSLTLVAVISQRLVKRADGSGRIAAQEIMINSPTIKKLIEEGKTGSIDKVIEDSASYYNMQSLNQGLFNLWQQKIISQEDALLTSNNPSDLKIKLQSETFSSSQEQQKPLGGGLDKRYGNYR